jgi:hypothetical protein
MLSCAWANNVTDDKQADELFKKARQVLGSLGLTVPREILLKLRTRDELMVENNSHGGRTLELNGFYQPYNPETIWVVSGLSEEETIAVMAHELTHAWQSTNAPQQDRKLSEGFARWSEYHVLLAQGHPDLAERLTRDSDPDYGGGLRFLLDLEKRQGTPAVMEYAKTQTKIP